MDVKKALETYKLITKNECLSKWSSDEEPAISMDIVNNVITYLEVFVKKSSSTIHPERNDTTRTIFLLHDGDCRLTGTAHVGLDDFQLSLVLVNLVHQILSSQVISRFVEM